MRITLKLTSLLLSLALPAFAQVPTPPTDPNRDRFIQPAPTPTPPAPSVLPSSAPTSLSPAVSDQLLTIDKIEVVGSTLFGPAVLRPLVKPLEGRTVPFRELQQAVTSITQLYLEQGYLTSRALLPEQKLQGGTVKIQVIEGKLTQLEITGLERLQRSYVENRIRLAASTPLNGARLEDQLRLLRVDPLFSNVEASLRAGQNLGESILAITVTEAPALKASASVDNYSPPSIGSERGVVSLSYRDLTGLGDELNASYTVSDGASNIYDLTYRLPLNPMNGTLQLRAVPSNNKVIESGFTSLGIRGNDSLYEISFRQPFIRTPQEEFALSLGFAVEDGQTFLFDSIPFGFNLGPDANGFSSTRVLKFGQDYLKRDDQGAWLLRSQFSLGTGLWDATTNEGDLPDGQFFSWLGQVQRLQSLGFDNLLIFQGDIQLSGNPLLPSQQFVIGGGQSLRGYRQNVRSGDNGFRLSAEGRLPITRNESGIPILQLAPFLEMGEIWNAPNNPNLLPDQQFLASAGLGVLWQPLPQLNLRVDYGIPLVNLSDRGTNLQDAGLYFSLRWEQP